MVAVSTVVPESQGYDGQSTSQDAFNCRQGPGQGGNVGAGGNAGPGGNSGNAGVVMIFAGTLPQQFAPIVAGGGRGDGGDPVSSASGGNFGNTGAAQLPCCNERSDRRGVQGAPGQNAQKGPVGAPGRTGVARA